MTTFSLGRQLACCRIPCRRGTLEVQRKKDGRKIADKHYGGRGATTIHQRLDTFSEVYWKMFLSPFLLYKKKEKKKENHVATSFVTAHAQEKTDLTPLLHFPINGRSAPSQAPASAHPAPEGQKVKLPGVRGSRGPPYHPACHLPLLHLEGRTHERCDSSEQRRSPVRTQKQIKITSAISHFLFFTHFHPGSM